jgi:hypothetical protein
MIICGILSDFHYRTFIRIQRVADRSGSKTNKVGHGNIMKTELETSRHDLLKTSVGMDAVDYAHVPAKPGYRR